jgi:two-component system alkaline phosphatase synthesis response regulator PhoP
VRKGKKKYELSNLEIEVLEMLIENEGHPVSRYKFLNEIWGYEVYPTTRTIDFHISRLRSKIEKDLSNPQHILTVHGMGYKFVGLQK